MIIKKGSVSMDSERLKIYNRNVIKVKEDINQFIKDIIEGKKDIQEMSDFVIISNQVQTLKNKYNALYYDIHNEQAEEVLFNFIKPEYESLRLISGLFQILNQYNEKQKLLNVETVKKEWDDIKIILRSHLVNKKLEEATISYFSSTKRKKWDGDKNTYIRDFFSYLEKNQNIFPDSEFISKMRIYQEKEKKERNKNDIENDVETYSEKAKQMKVPQQEAEQRIRFPHYVPIQDKVASISISIKRKIEETLLTYETMINKIDLEEDLLEKEYESVQTKNKDVRLDYSFYEGLSLVGKKEYLRLLLSNIERAKTPKQKRVVHFGGKKIKIPKAYYAKYLEYKALYITVKKNLRIEEERLDKELRVQEKDLTSLLVISEAEKEIIAKDLENEIDKETVAKIYEEDKQKLQFVEKKVNRELQMFHITPEMEEFFQENYCGFIESLNVMRRLERDAQRQLYKGLVSTTLSVTGKSVCIPTVKEREYKEAKGRYEKYKEKLELFSKNTGIRPIYTQEDLILLEENLDKIHDKLQIQNVTNSLEMKEEMDSLLKARICLLRDKKFSLHALLMSYFRSNELSLKDSKFYTTILYSLEKLEDLNIFKDKEKLTLFQKIQKKMKSIALTNDDILDGEWWILEEQKLKIKEILASLPSSFISKVSKIKKVKKPRTSKKIRNQINVASIAIAIGAGIVTLSSVSIYDHVNAKTKDTVNYESEISNDLISSSIVDVSNVMQNKVITFTNSSKNMERHEQENSALSISKKTDDISSLPNETISMNKLEQKSKPEENIMEESQNLHLRWGDIIYNLKDTPVYTSFDRAAKQIEPLKAYCPPESGKEITGIIYSYNGTEIFMGQDNFLYTENDLTAIENMGAIQIGYRVINKDTGMEEGYFNISGLDTNKMKEGGLKR